jgi:hypothetical protein
LEGKIKGKIGENGGETYKKETRKNRGKWGKMQGNPEEVGEN